MNHVTKIMFQRLIMASILKGYCLEYIVHKTAQLLRKQTL